MNRLSCPGWSASFALLGTLVGLVITPFMASVWAYEPGVGWSGGLVERAFGPMLESAGLLDFGGEGIPYEVYGKFFFLVYLLMIPVVCSVRPPVQEGSRIQQASRWAWRAMFTALLVATVGDFASYWGKSVPGPVGEGVWGMGFAVEFLSVMALLASTVVFAGINWKTQALPRYASVLLVAGVLAVVPVNVFVTDYWPNSLVVPLSVAWAVFAIWRVFEAKRAAVPAVAAPAG